MQPLAGKKTEKNTKIMANWVFSKTTDFDGLKLDMHAERHPRNAFLNREFSTTAYTTAGTVTYM